MKITKFGHCCLLIEQDNTRILTDPGVYTVEQNSLTGLDAIVITHEHADHCHVDSLKEVLKNNPEAVIITNNGVGKILEENGIKYYTVSGGEQIKIKNILIEGFGERHAHIYNGVPEVENTGYLIDGKLFFPGDSFYVEPGKTIHCLALPVAGPWLKISEAIFFAKKLRPTKAFPVHDGMLKNPGGSHQWPKKFLAEEGIEFLSTENNIPFEI